MVTYKSAVVVGAHIISLAHHCVPVTSKLMVTSSAGSDMIECFILRCYYIIASGPARQVYGTYGGVLAYLRSVSMCVVSDKTSHGATIICLRVCTRMDNMSPLSLQRASRWIEPL